VGDVVTYALQDGLRSDCITNDSIERAAREATGQPLSLTPEQVKQALDPLLSLESKRALGSPSALEIRKLIQQAQGVLRRQQRTAREWQTRIQHGSDELHRAVTASI